jgi:hypothetical protein
MATAYRDHPKAPGTMYSLGVFFPQNSSAIENLCGRFRHKKRSQNVVGRTHTQFVIIYKIPFNLGSILGAHIQTITGHFDPFSSIICDMGSNEFQ